MDEICTKATFRKSEKLCSVTDISRLFKSKSLFFFPYKVTYIIEPSISDVSDVKVLCSVGKRYSKSAVKRNKMKRRLRESYRLNKQLLYKPLFELPESFSIKIAFIYVSKNEELYETHQSAIKKALKSIATIIAQNINSDSNPID